MKKALLTTLFLLLALPLYAKNPINEPKGFDKKIYNAVFALYGTLGDKNQAMCTATAFEKSSDGYHFITAGHCVILAPAEIQFSVAPDIGGKQIPATVVSAHMDDKLDMAIFDVKTTEKIQTIPLGNENTERVGNDIIFVGFGEGMYKQISHGAISTQIMGNDSDCSVCANKFLIQGTAADGSSGSAIISKKTHKIIGILTNGGDIGQVIQPISTYKDLSGIQAHENDKPEDLIQQIIDIIGNGPQN